MIRHKYFHCNGIGCGICICIRMTGREQVDILISKNQAQQILAIP